MMTELPYTQSTTEDPDCHMLRAYLGRETILVGIAADGGYALNTEIEGFNGETGFLEKGHDETA